MQFSVFEIEVDPAQWATLKARLAKTIDPKQDSLRYYYLPRKLRDLAGAQAGFYR